MRPILLHIVCSTRVFILHSVPAIKSRRASQFATFNRNEFSCFLCLAEQSDPDKKVWRPGQSGASWREKEKERIERWRRPSETENPGRNSEERGTTRRDDDQDERKPAGGGDDWRGAPRAAAAASPERRPAARREEDADRRAPAPRDEGERRPPMFGGGGGWRERQAAKGADDGPRLVRWVIFGCVEITLEHF